MEQNILETTRRKIERRLSRLGAKIAEATEISHRAVELSNTAEDILINVQKEVEELYLTIDEACLAEVFTGESRPDRAGADKVVPDGPFSERGAN